MEFFLKVEIGKNRFCQIPSLANFIFVKICENLIWIPFSSECGLLRKAGKWGKLENEILKEAKNAQKWHFLF